MPRIRVAEGLSMPVDALTQRFALLARTGAGKSYAAGDLAEEFLQAKQQIVVIDPNGAWWGLRSSADGKGPGYPILIMGGDHGDVPLEPTSGAMVADLVVHDGVSVILDLSKFETDADEVRFVTAFVDRLFRKNKHALHLFVDEADSFAPQAPQKHENIMLNRMARLAKRGRSKGIGLSLISQRSAAISKRVLSQTEVMVAMQTTDPRDRKAIAEWMQGKGSEEEQKRVLGSLASLKIGDAWVWSPVFLRLLKRVTFRKKRTFDSSATPKVGGKHRTPKVLAQVDIEQLRVQMASTIEKAKQEDPAALRKELAAVKKELAAARGLRSRGIVASKPEIREVRVEVPVLSTKDVKLLNQTVKNMEGIAKEFRGVGAFGAKLTQYAEAVRTALTDASRLIGEAQADATGMRGMASSGRRTFLESSPNKPLGRVPTPPQATVPKPAGPIGNGTLKTGQLRILRAMAKCHPVRRTMAQIATLSNYTASGGTFQANFGQLVKHGYFYEEHGLFGLDGKGIEEAGTAVPYEPAGPAERIKMWSQSLRGKETLALGALVEVYPKWLTRESLGDAIRLAPSGGTFGAVLSTLRANDLADITKQGLRAKPALFE